MYKVLKMSKASENINDLTFTDYYYRLMLLARALFKWENLPNGIDEKWIERYLFSEGKCMFFYDDNLGYFVTDCVLSGGVNCNNEPINLIPITTGVDVIEQKEYTNFTGRVTSTKEKPFTKSKNGKLPTGKKGAILIKNNDVMLPTSFTINLFALRLTEIQRTIDINIEAQQTPTLITGSEKQRLSLSAIYRKWKGHEPVIFGDKSLDGTPLNVLKTDAPIVFDKLQIQKHSVWNEVMTFLGVNNANMDKRERLVDDEVQANNEQIELSADIMLKSREKACELINTLFDLPQPVKVSLRTEKEIREIIQGGVTND